ncbi:MAG: DUF1844 domain-containing protein [Candidatus Korobacteraceae bacterium]|jgi:hypothetical protein
MTDEKKTSFTVTDRRKFTVEGEPRPEGQEESQQSEPEVRKPSAPAAAAKPPAASPEPPPPAAPSAQEQHDQAQRYAQSSRELDSQLQRELEGQGRKASDFEMTFEKFVASLYMTALLQLGLVHEQGAQPTADLIGARQTIDTISLLAEKTKGNLTSREENMMSNILYELRMAYVEVTNALVHPPAGAPPDPKAGTR